MNTLGGKVVDELDFLEVELEDGFYRFYVELMNALCPGAWDLEYYGEDKYVLQISQESCYYAVWLLEQLGGRVTQVERRVVTRSQSAAEMRIQFRNETLLIPAGTTPVPVDYRSAEHLPATLGHHLQSRYGSDKADFDDVIGSLSYEGQPLTVDQKLRLVLASVRLVNQSHLLEGLQLLRDSLRTYLGALVGGEPSAKQMEHVFVVLEPMVDTALFCMSQLPGISGKRLKVVPARVQYIRLLVAKLRVLSQSQPHKRLVSRRLKTADMYLDFCQLIRQKRYPGDYWTYMRSALAACMWAVAHMLGLFVPRRVKKIVVLKLPPRLAQT